jgi:hypothetical protein
VGPRAGLSTVVASKHHESVDKEMCDSAELDGSPVGVFWADPVPGIEIPGCPG